MTEKIRNKLISMGEAEYKEFSSALMPTVDKSVSVKIKYFCR